VCVDRQIAASSDALSFAFRNARQLSAVQRDCHSSRASHPESGTRAQWTAALDHIQDSDSATRPAHRIQFRIAQRLPEVRLIQRAGIVAPLPNVTT
jgi:hypothetical protein